MPLTELARGLMHQRDLTRDRRQPATGPGTLYTDRGGRPWYAVPRRHVSESPLPGVWNWNALAGLELEIEVMMLLSELLRKPGEDLPEVRPIQLPGKDLGLAIQHQDPRDLVARLNWFSKLTAADVRLITDRTDQEIRELVRGHISSPYWAEVITDDLRHRRDALFGRRGGADPGGTLPGREQAGNPDDVITGLRPRDPAPPAGVSTSAGGHAGGRGVRMAGPRPGVPGRAGEPDLGAVVAVEHGVYVPRGDGPGLDQRELDHLSGRALRTFPGAFTVAAHLVQASSDGPPGDAVWWDGLQVTARQFAGLVGRLAGYREARALNGGQPPVLVLVICEAAAAEAGSFAAVVDGLYPGRVVAATSALLQPADGAGDVVALGGGGFVYWGDGGGRVGLGGELTGAVAALAGGQDPPVPAVVVSPPQDAYRLYVELGRDVVFAGAVGAGDAGLGAAGLGWLGAAELGGAVAGRALEVVAGFGAVVSAVRAAGPGARGVVSFTEFEGVDERVVEVGADGRGRVVFWDGRAGGLAVLPASPVMVRFALTAGAGAGSPGAGLGAGGRQDGAGWPAGLGRGLAGRR